MAQVLTEKRKRIASLAVTSATSLLDAENGLLAMKFERAQSGNFVDAEFATPELQHLTAFLVGLLLDTVVGEIETFLDAKIGGNQNNPTRREVLLQMRR